MIYANPVPQEFASGEYYNREAAQYYLSPAKLESDYAPTRFERELRLFRRYCSGGDVLDVGCSSGAFLFQLTKQFPGAYQVLGTDVSRKQFDAVTFWAVLEHLFEPKRFIEKAQSLLKPGGLCFVLVPNMKSLAIRLLGERYRYIYPQHLNYFSEDSLRLLGRWRFSVLEVRTTHFNPIVIWQDWRSRGREVSNAERGDLLKRTTACKQNPLLRPLKWGYSVAEKALSVFGLADNLVAVLKKC